MNQLSLLRLNSRLKQSLSWNNAIASPNQDKTESTHKVSKCKTSNNSFKNKKRKPQWRKQILLLSLLSFPLVSLEWARDTCSVMTLNKLATNLEWSLGLSHKKILWPTICKNGRRKTLRNLKQMPWKQWNNSLQIHMDNRLKKTWIMPNYISELIKDWYYSLTRITFQPNSRQ